MDFIHPLHNTIHYNFHYRYSVADINEKGIGQLIQLIECLNNDKSKSLFFKLKRLNLDKDIKEII